MSKLKDLIASALRLYTLIRIEKLLLRVFLSFFDLTLKTHHSLTDDPRPNPIFLLKHLAQRVDAYSISADTAPPSGSSELCNFKF